MLNKLTTEHEIYLLMFKSGNNCRDFNIFEQYKYDNPSLKVMNDISIPLENFDYSTVYDS